mgnify:CR=1 FL=1
MKFIISLLIIPVLLFYSLIYSEENIRETPIVKAVRKVSPAIVNISTERIISVRNDPFFGFGHGIFDEQDFGTRQYKASSLGSGVIIDEDGYILTNDHVISKASKIIITLSDGEKFEGRLISSYPQKDLAVVKIDSNYKLPYIELGNSDDLMIGETTIAVGNPYGLEHTVTTGVLSAKNRSVENNGRVVFDNFIQTDAAINPGNSGGALLNLEGELIGINTAIIPQAQGIGFAIPVNTVKEVLEKLLDHRKINKTWFGANLQTINENLAVEKGISAYEGILVIDIDKNSPAESSGLLSGDIISEIDGNPIKSVLDYDRLMLRKKEGEEVKLVFLRNGKKKTASIVLAKLPKPSPHDLALSKFGFDIQRLTPRDAKSLYIEVDDGLIVSKVVENGPADQRGIEVGDVIVQLGDYRVRTLDDIAVLLSRIEKGDTVTLGFIRGQYIIRTRLTSS